MFVDGGGTGAGAAMDTKIPSPEVGIWRQRCLRQRPHNKLVNSGSGASDGVLLRPAGLMEGKDLSTGSYTVATILSRDRSMDKFFSR